MRGMLSLSQIAQAVWNYAGSVTSRAVNVTQVDGAALDTHDAGSFPSDVRTWNGTAPASLGTGNRLDVNVTTNNDKTGYTASTVSDKTGYSLTAGSYSIRASSTQDTTVSFGTGDTSKTATISSVTTTRAVIHHNGSQFALDDITAGLARLALTNSTTVTGTRSAALGTAQTTAVMVAEWF